MIAAAIAMAIRLESWVLQLAAIVVIAGRQVALLNLVHAAAHREFFRTRRLDALLQFLFAYPILDSVATYRRQHLQHHREYASRSRNRYEFLHGHLRLPSLGPWGRTWIVFVRPLLGHSGARWIVDTIKTASRDKPSAVGILVLWTPVVAASIGCGFWPHFLLYWVLPLFYVYPILNLWAEISDHFAVQGSLETRDHGGLFNALLLKPHDCFHEFHHRRPAIPFYRHKGIVRSLSTPGVEWSRGFVDFIRCCYRRSPTQTEPRLLDQIE